MVGPDTNLIVVPSHPPAVINFNIGGTYYFLDQKVIYGISPYGCIDILAKDGNGGLFHISISYDGGGDTVTTTNGTLIYAKSGQGYFTYICNQALHATAIFKADTIHGTFYGVLQYDNVYSSYPPIQGRFDNVPASQ